ncbi:hypothetical protein PCK2_000006 [Pneumocystis canis]|nr:hypothetical protein PCK2_000006 [Pneumocystis canis]
MGKNKKQEKSEKSVKTLHPDQTHETSDSDASTDSVSPIARPLVPKKLRKKVFKTLKRGMFILISFLFILSIIASQVKHVQRGVKEVVKALKRGEKGLVVLAGDISPIDVISHLPVLCEDYSCPYVFVPSKESLGQASNTQRPTSCLMVIPGGKNKDMSTANDTYMKTYEKILKYAESVRTWDYISKDI